MDILIKILQFILSFSLLIIIHELGHFMFARIFRVRVERFQLFFGKPIFSFKKGDTEYGIGWIPFGGFVKMAGMIDESMDTDFVGQDPQSYEFRSKPAWQRLLIMVGGVLMNLVLAFLIYVGMSYAWGDQYLSTSDMKYGYAFSELAEEMGFRDGDKIITVNGKHYEDFDQMRAVLLIEQNNRVEIERDGQVLEIVTPDVAISRIGADFITPRYPFVIDSAIAGGTANLAGLRHGDRLVSFNDTPMTFFDQYLDQFSINKGTLADIGVQRDSAGVLLTKVIPVRISDDGKIGASIDLEAVTPIHDRRYTLLQSFPAGFKRTGSEISGYWKQLKLIFKPKTEAYKSLGGPLSIGNIFPSTWDWYRFWNITALLSVILAIMNILPIPALDGGHVLFLLVEVITGRKPGDKFMTYAQLVGLALLLMLMIYATGNDIYRLFIKQ